MITIFNRIIIFPGIRYPWALVHHHCNGEATWKHGTFYSPFGKIIW